MLLLSSDLSHRGYRGLSHLQVFLQEGAQRTRGSKFIFKNMENNEISVASAKLGEGYRVLVPVPENSTPSESIAILPETRVLLESQQDQT